MKTKKKILFYGYVIWKPTIVRIIIIYQFLQICNWNFTFTEYFFSTYFYIRMVSVVSNLLNNWCFLKAVWNNIWDPKPKTKHWTKSLVSRLNIISKKYSLCGIQIKRSKYFRNFRILEFEMRMLMQRSLVLFRMFYLRIC